MIIKSSFSFSWTKRIRFFPVESGTRIRTFRPEGSVNMLSGTSSGIHPHMFTPYIRRTPVDGSTPTRVYLHKNRYSHHNHPTAMDCPIVDYMDMLSTERDKQKTKLHDHQWKVISEMMKHKKIEVIANGKPIFTATQSP